MQRLPYATSEVYDKNSSDPFINANPFDSKDRSQIPAKVLLFLPKGCIVEEASETTCILSRDSISWMQVTSESLIETGVLPKICHQI